MPNLTPDPAPQAERGVAVPEVATLADLTERADPIAYCWVPNAIGGKGVYVRGYSPRDRAYWAELSTPLDEESGDTKFDSDGFMLRKFCHCCLTGPPPEGKVLPELAQLKRLVPALQEGAVAEGGLIRPGEMDRVGNLADALSGFDNSASRLLKDYPSRGLTSISGSSTGSAGSRAKSAPRSESASGSTPAT